MRSQKTGINIILKIMMMIGLIGQMKPGRITHKYQKEIILFE